VVVLGTSLCSAALVGFVASVGSVDMVRVVVRRLHKQASGCFESSCAGSTGWRSRGDNASYLLLIMLDPRRPLAATQPRRSP
jgi:hypothetical protein